MFLPMLRVLRDPDPANDAGGGGGAGNDEPASDPSKGGDKQTFEVDGKKVTLTELKDGFGKAAGADAKFQEAAKVRKENESAIQLQADIKLVSETNDEGAFRRVAAASGWEPAKIEQALAVRQKAQIRAAMGADDNPASDAGGDAGDADGGEGLTVEQIAVQVAEKIIPLLKQTDTITWDRLDPRIQKVIGGIVNKSWDDLTNRELDADDFFANLRKKGSAGQKAAVDSLVQGESQRRAASGEDITDPTVLRAILKDVRGRMEALEVVPAGSKVSGHPGLGSSGGEGGFQPGDEPVKRPKGGLVDGGQEMDAYITDMVQREMDEVPV
jgi:hypothetical protein